MKVVKVRIKKYIQFKQDGTNQKQEFAEKLDIKIVFYTNTIKPCDIHKYTFFKCHNSETNEQRQFSFASPFFCCFNYILKKLILLDTFFFHLCLFSVLLYFALLSNEMQSEFYGITKFRSSLKILCWHFLKPLYLIDWFYVNWYYY